MIDFYKDGVILTGFGVDWEAAILDLAEQVKANRQVQADGILAKALNQPAGKGWPIVEPVHPSQAPGIDRLDNVGRRVLYTPASDDVFQEHYQVVAGIITKAWSGSRMDLLLFTSGTNVRHSVEYSDTPKPGTWCWPKKQ